MSERPFLPPSPQRKFLSSPIVRGLGLWLLLIVVFLAIWAWLQPSGSPAPEVARHHVHRASSSWGLFALMVWTLVKPPNLFFLITFVVCIWTVTRLRTFSKANGLALKSISEGDYTGAASQLEGLTRRFRWPAMVRAVARSNLGVALLHQGKLAEALDRFAAAERDVGAARHIKANVAAHLATVNALRGALEVAKKWRTEAESRLASAPDPGYTSAQLAFASAVVDLREGRHDDVARRLEEQWAKLEGSATARTTRPLRVLRAFALAQRGEREAGAAQKVLAALDPTRTGEFVMLEAEWPEMQTFLRAHGM
jgi:hypothetical protein